MAYDGTLKFDTKIDSSGFQSGLSKLGGLAKTGLTAATAAVGAVSSALMAAGGYAVKVGSSFEQGMAQVSAISGATGTELDALTEKAAEMGAKTIFSATQSAEAFQYMAMAGWKTEDMLSGIEGIMNLAAASGEDLGQTSDIVTDALTAFGLQAKDSAHFADVLAKAASNSNTNVGLMGYTFKYAAPIAGALKYSVEDVAVAIGLMANAGVKGEMAGTSLRSMLTRLAKPTEDVEEAMSELGISATKADGSMKPLNQLLKELRGKFANLSDSQKAEYAATIAGQEAMSGMLAIVNASQEDFDNLTAAIGDADGAAQDMADTMQDTLHGDITILKSSLEGLGNTVYEELQDPLRGAAQAGIDYVNQLKDAFERGGLQEAVATAGDIFAELAVKAAEKAPKMIEAAVSFIQSFVSGIRDHAGEISNAAVSVVQSFVNSVREHGPELLEVARTIVNTLVDGLVSLLPSEIQKPVKEAVETLKKSFESGGLRDAIKTVVDLLKEIARVATNIAKVILPPLATLVDMLAVSFQALAPLITAAAAGFVAMKVVGTVTTLISHLRDALSLATIAQNLWNAAMNANPIGLLIGGVATLAAGIGILCAAMGDGESDADRLAAAQDRAKEANDRLKGSVDDLAESYRESAEYGVEFQKGIENAESYLDGFNDELFASSEEQQALVDEMDKIQEGITTICKTASDERRGYTEEEIEQLDNYFERMRELVAKQAEIQKRKSDAIEEQALRDAQNFEGSADEYAEVAQRWIKTAEEQADNRIKAAENAATTEIAALMQSRDAEKDLTEERKKYYEDQISYWENYRKTEKEKAQKQIGDITSAYSYGYIQRADDAKQYLAELKDIDGEEEKENERHHDAVWGFYERRADIEDQYRFDRDGYNKAMADLAVKEEEEETRHKDELDRINQLRVANFDDSEKEQISVWLNLLGQTEMYGGEIIANQEELAKSFVDPWLDMKDDMREAGKNAYQPLLDELDSVAPQLFARAVNIPNTFLSLLNRAFGNASPSKKTRRSMRYVMEGAQLGLKDETPELFKQSEGIASGLLSRFQDIKFDASALVQKMRAAIAAEHSRISASLSATADYQMMQSTARRTAEESTTDNNSYVAEIHVDLDGREVARATAPFMGSQLAWEG